MAVSEWRIKQFGDRNIGLYVPDAFSVKQAYDAARDRGEDVLFPYWAHLWPASIAICEWLAESPGMIEGKRVLEIAAGLGLPSLLAAGIASTVCCTDRSPEAMELVKASALRNGITDLETKVLNWNDLPDDLPFDLVMLSDVNYDPNDLQDLSILFDRLLSAGISIVLSTPERIVAADLLNYLIPFVRKRRQFEPEPGRIIHVFFLSQSADGFTSSR